MKKGIITLCLAAAILQMPASAAAQTGENTAAQKLNAEDFTIVDETISHLQVTKRGAAILFDSQDQVPDKPELAKIQIPGKTWQPNYKVEWGKPSFYIDLGAYYVITDIGYMDMNGTPVVTVYDGQPFAWEERGVLETNYYNTWRVKKYTNTEAVRYLKIESANSDTGINEIGLYGYKVRELTEEDNALTAAKPTAMAPDQLTSGQKIGANGFCDDPYTALAALGNVREYYNWSWLTDKNGAHWFNRVVGKDAYYKTLQSMGISVIPCLQMTTDAFVTDGKEMSKIKNTIPVVDGADTLDPVSYSLHSNAMYNLAARYGSNTDIDTSTLNVGDGDVKTGLNYLKHVETWNEQDKTWETKASYFHPYEYAAMMSADYDGHEGKIENGGVKTADPNFKLVMGGLAGGDNATQYLSLMKTWFDYNREDGEFACDVINYHDYITDTEAPEQSDFRDNIRKITAWTEENAPGRDIWLSEFDVLADDKKIDGLDSHDNPQYATARAERLLRAFLVGEREGLDRMSMFMLRDEWSGIYYNTGLTTGKGDWDKKTSWYYVSSATDTLKNADLVSYTESDNVYVYTYKDRSTSETIYAVWSPTANGSVLENYQLSVPGFDKAIQVKPVYGVKEGEKSFLPIEAGTVAIDVTESPVFIKVSNSDVPNDYYEQKLIAVQQMRLGENNGNANTVTFDNEEVVNVAAGEVPSETNFMLGQFYQLFDEQTPDKTAATPWQKTRVKPVTESGGPAIKREQSFPYDCVVTFDDNYLITYIGVYDSFSVGKLEIYDDVTGDLLFTSKLDSFNTWVLMPMQTQMTGTNRIRIVKYDGAKLNELAFYGHPADRRIGIDVAPVPGEIGTALSAAKNKIDVAGIELGEISRNSSGNLNTIQQAFENIVDEQDKMPKNDEISAVNCSEFKTNFSNIYGKDLNFPLDAVVRFGNPTLISRAAVYVGWGENTGKFEVYNEETGELLASDVLTGNAMIFYMDFKEPVETSALRIVKYNSRTICEVGFY